MERRLGPGILTGPIGEPARRPDFPRVEAVTGLVVVHLGSRFRGAVIGIEHDGGVTLRSANTGLERVFRMTPGSFAVGGAPVNLVRPAQRRGDAGSPSPGSPLPGSPLPGSPLPGSTGSTGSTGSRPTASRLTASGSVAVPGARARVARRSRILVEGVHDAELVEKVWGDDLRIEAVVVERLDGIDVLAEVVAAFAPAPGARLGVLVDHLVPASKESRIAADVASPYVMVTGTPYVDVWQAIKPRVIGIEAWPVIPRGRSWKEGICAALGEREPGRLWRRLLGSVNTYADLEPSLVGAVEALIDFVTADSGPADSDPADLGPV